MTTINDLDDFKALEPFFRIIEQGLDGLAEALEEGVTMRWLSTVAHADAGTLLIEKMRLDDSDFP